MIYKFILKEGYHKIEFLFVNYAEGCAFMQSALKHAESEINFEVEFIEGEVNEECTQSSES